MSDTPTTWPPDLPSGWTAPLLNKVARLGTGHTPSRSRPEYWKDCRIPWITVSDLGRLSDSVTEISETVQKISELGLANSAAVLHPAGTVALSRTASIGYSVIMAVPMAVTQGFVTWTCGPRILPRFLLYQLRAMRPYLASISRGSTHRTIFFPDIQAIRTALPPTMEHQRIVVDFLDRETHRIDALIEAKKKLIDLLAEKRTALITHAVTKGIDPTVPMKDSGVEWVGEVPAAWKATRLGRAIDGWYSGGTPESGNPRFWSDDPEDVAFVRIGDMSGREVVQETAQRVTSAGCQEKGLRILPTGTLIFAMYASMGEVAILGLRATINQALISLMPSSRTSVDWLYFWLRSIRPILPVYAKSTTQDNLSAETTLQLPLLLPPRDEQDMIVRKLRERTSMIESGMARLQEQLGLLNESRQALITAAVTGQLDESTLTGSKSTDEALRTELPA